uniref:Uncharacterized protein n=1 Tax=Plectus sambesii TaxID=2011161 RepID=A0A914WKP6_9BILA
MRFIITLALLIVINRQVTDGARWCMSGAGQSYREKLCGTGGDHNVDCHVFQCEGGRSPFVLRTCGGATGRGGGCAAGIATCNRAGGTGSCSTCNTDNCNTSPRSGIPTGNGGNNNGGHNYNNNANGHNGGGHNNRNGGNGRPHEGDDRGRDGDRTNGGNSNNRGSFISKLINMIVKGSNK